MSAPALGSLEFGLLLRLYSHGPCVAGPVRLPEVDEAIAGMVRAGLVTATTEGDEPSFAITDAGRAAVAAAT